MPLSRLGVILYPEGRDSFELVGHAAFGDVSQKVLLQFMTAVCSEGMWDRCFLGESVAVSLCSQATIAWH